ncbi:MAG: acyl transferase [Chitinophagaceae bacterium]
MECEFDAKTWKNDASYFNEHAVRLFHYQYANNKIYREYVDLLKIPAGKLRQWQEIPFLPISFFKSHPLQSGNWIPETWFESSGTTGTQTSRHFVRSLDTYRNSFMEGFRLFYGEPSDWCIIGLLPAYLERQHSSLVVMTDALIKASGHPESGFYLYNHEELARVLQQNEQTGQKTLLIGVTFALLDFAEKYPLELKHTVVLETGGMKGRRRELTRSEIHETLHTQWKLATVHAEYGMTELFSQAYSKGHGIFSCPPWMKVVLREEDDPLALVMPHPSKPVSGAINIIDLANVDSCAFIATEDVGRLHPDGRFEVLGRMDNTDIRGCSLLVV